MFSGLGFIKIGFPFFRFRTPEFNAVFGGLFILSRITRPLFRPFEVDDVIGHFVPFLFFVWRGQTTVHEAYASGTERRHAAVLCAYYQYSSLRAKAVRPVNGREAQLSGKTN
jgi:hypothetical protein